MYIIVGLGNPTKEYENTRHNAGFMAIDALADKLSISMNSSKHKSIVGTGYIEGQKVLLMKPLTYMNLSGEAIIDAVNFYKIDPQSELIVIYDDIAMDVGKLRLRAKGSAGGHNGIKSIISHLGNDKFKRVRIGVGNKPDGYDLAAYVLGHFSAEDKPLIKEACDKVVSAITLSIQSDFDKAMNAYN